MSPAEPQSKAEFPPESPPIHKSSTHNGSNDGRAKNARTTERAPDTKQLESTVALESLPAIEQAGTAQQGELEPEALQAESAAGHEHAESKVAVVSRGSRQPGRITGGGQSRRMTGPRTAHGKRRSSRNAVKHGIFAKVVVIKGESRAEFDAFLKELQESLRPVGALEHLLVEKLALLAWRYRRMVIAEGAEIQKAVDFFQWDRDLNREHSIDSSLSMAKFAGGLISHLRSPEMIDRCIELAEDLRSSVARWGFDLERDGSLLTTLYGTNLEHPPRHSLLKSYGSLAVMAKKAVEQEDQDEEGDQAARERIHASVQDCKDMFLRELDSQIRWLRRSQKQFGAVEADRTQLELLTRRIPDAAKSDRLLRYEAALERGFDRALGQLERLQRMRLGLATLPPLRLELSG